MQRHITSYQIVSHVISPSSELLTFEPRSGSKLESAYPFKQVEVYDSSIECNVFFFKPLGKDSTAPAFNFILYVT